jgi:hypothetical protein
MKIRLSTLRRVLRQTLVETPVYSTLNVKPGMKLRYTGMDMEKPPLLKVLNVGNGVVTAGDKQGKVHKIGEKDLHSGEYEILG